MNKLFSIAVILSLILGSFIVYKKFAAPFKEPEASNMQTLKISSTSFADGGDIPSKYTCDGEDVNPPFVIEGIPENAQSLAFILDDPDAPSGTWTHWIMWDMEISGDYAVIEEGQKPRGISGKNSSGNNSYQGPCPPDGGHRYYLRVFALDSTLGLKEGSSREELENALEGRVIAQGEIMGKYRRSKRN